MHVSSKRDLIFDVTSPMLSLGHREWVGVLGHLISIFMR